MSFSNEFTGSCTRCSQSAVPSDLSTARSRSTAGAVMMMTMMIVLDFARRILTSRQPILPPRGEGLSVTQDTLLSTFLARQYVHTPTQRVRVPVSVQQSCSLTEIAGPFSGRLLILHTIFILTFLN